MSLGYTVATLVALDDVLNLFQLQSVNISNSVSQITVDLEIKSSRKQIISLTERCLDERLNGVQSLFDRSSLWWELLGNQIDSDTFVLGRWMLAKHTLEEISSANLIKEPNSTDEWRLTYLFRQITVRRTIKLGDLEEEYQKRLCAFVMTQGYFIEELVGKIVKITTPTGFVRSTNGQSCDCSRYLQTKQKCLHTQLAESYLANRKVYLKYGAAKQVEIV